MVDSPISVCLKTVKICIWVPVGFQNIAIAGDMLNYASDSTLLIKH